MKLRQKGQSIVEFALIIPFVLMFLLSIIYGGMIVSDYLSLKHLSASAARSYANNGDDSEFKNLSEHTVLITCDTPDTKKVDVENTTNLFRVQVKAALVKDKFPELMWKLLPDNFTENGYEVYSAPEVKTNSN